MAVFLRQLHGHAHGPAPGYDGHLMHRIRAGKELGREGMPCFVVSRDLFFLFAQDEASPLLAHEDFVFGILEVGHFEVVLVHFGGLQRSFVDKVFKVSAGKTRRALCQDADIDVIGEGSTACMDLKDAFTSAQIGRGDDDLPVESSWTEQGGVKDVRSVRSRNEDDSFVGFKAVHLNKELVEGLLPFVVPAAETGAALTSDGIDLIDEDEAGGIFFALRKQVSHAGSAHADEHFYEIGTGYGKERDARFACDGAGQKGLARSWRSNEQYALGDASAEPCEFAGIGKEFDYFSQFFFCFVDASDIGERDLGRLILILKPGRGAPERHGASRAALHLARKVYPDGKEDEHGQRGNEKREEQRTLLGRQCGYLHPFFQKSCGKIGILGGNGAI